MFLILLPVGPPPLSQREPKSHPLALPAGDSIECSAEHIFTKKPHSEPKFSVIFLFVKETICPRIRTRRRWGPYGSLSKRGQGNKHCSYFKIWPKIMRFMFQTTIHLCKLIFSHSPWKIPRCTCNLFSTGILLSKSPSSEGRFEFWIWSIRIKAGELNKWSNRMLFSCFTLMPFKEGMIIVMLIRRVVSMRSSKIHIGISVASQGDSFEGKYTYMIKRWSICMLSRTFGGEGRWKKSLQRKTSFTVSVMETPTISSCFRHSWIQRLKQHIQDLAFLDVSRVFSGAFFSPSSRPSKHGGPQPLNLLIQWKRQPHFPLHLNKSPRMWSSLCGVVG